ncbi:helix-turn-helix domain-containing protein [Paenibacillus cremeus]|uniref:Helix-turn-helix transcriptional regulator n=1 Tax=Paenibacillus cremeus TaxID=2163881 RepID=A0A559KFN1_9BACL|nr:AraC family transcriptional regulator [Paenibacillus cremeus]TVY10935.1 helix-turn-helix transcriptional regulator [Paenibacillus cremeus]
MLPLAGRITEAMQLRFLHIKQYDLPHTWRIDRRVLEHAVIWLIEEGALTLEAAAAEESLSLRGGAGEPEALPCGAGELLFFPPGTLLSCRAQSASLQLISLNYETAAPLERGGRWPASLRLPLRYGGDTAELAAVLRLMLADDDADSAGKPLLMQAGLLRLLGLMAARRAPALDARSADGGSDPRVADAIAHMSQRPAAQPSVKQLAEAVGTSESHLRKLFLRDTGMAPLQYWHALKAKLAMRRLAATSEHVSEIAHALGYEDANYFSRVFKKVIGLTPQEYRRKHRDWMQLPAE